MTTSHTEPSDVMAPPVYSPLDFAVITVLEKIKNDVVRPRINHWKEEVIRDKRKLLNLAAGLLSVWDTLLITGDGSAVMKSLDEFVWGKSDIDPKQLCALLDQHGHFLFNCYYYTLLKEYGQECLVTAIPGYTYKRKEDGAPGLIEFIRASQLPLHLNDEYLEEYSNLALPLRAGITPRYVQLYRLGISDLRGTWLVPNFLGDLAILWKREDYIHRHLCALISVLSDKNGPQGAFVLTSAIPYGLEPEDAENLSKVIQESWTRAPLSDLHRNLQHRTVSSTESYVTWGGSEGQAISPALENLKVEENIQQCLGTLMPDGAYALRGTLYDTRQEICSLAAVSPQGLQRVLDCQFPSSPWLDPSIVEIRNDPTIKTMSDSPIAAVINSDRLRDICVTVEKFSSASVPYDERRLAFSRLLEVTSWRGLMQSLFPDLTVMDLIDTLPAWDFLALNDSDEQPCARLLVIRKSASDADSADDCAGLNEFAEGVRRAFQEPELPGSNNSFLTRLQGSWNRLQGSNTKTSPQLEPVIQSLIFDLETIFLNPNVRGVILLLDRATYVPQFGQVKESTEHSAKREMFRSAFCSYPSFWLFESLCHSFAEDIEFSALEKALMEKVSSPPFVSDAKQGPLYNIFLSADNNVNRMVASAFTYLGIPVYEWVAPAHQPLKELERFTIPANEGPIAQWINECYRSYLLGCLKLGEGNESISRALRTNMDSRRAKATSIEVQNSSGNIINMFIELGGLGERDHITWQRVPTVDLAFSAFPITNICKEHVKRRNAASKTKTLELQVDAIQYDGSTKTFSATADAETSHPVVAPLYRTLYESLQTLRWGFQVGQGEKLRRISHEARIALNLITRLFDQTPEPGKPLDEEVVQDMLRNIETAKRGATYLLSSLNAVLDWQVDKSVLSFDDKTRPSDYLQRLLELAVHIGVAEVIRSPDGYFTLHHAELLIPSLVDSIRANSRLPAEELHLVKGGERAKAEHIILVTVSNAVKHQLLYLRARVLDPDLLIKFPLFFWNEAIVVNLDAVSNCLTVENLGPDGTAESFNERFAQRKDKGTYSVLNAIVKDKAWSRAGEIVLDVRQNDDSMYESLDERVHRCLTEARRYVVKVHLPTPFFEVK